MFIRVLTPKTSCRTSLQQHDGIARERITRAGERSFVTMLQISWHSTDIMQAAQFNKLNRNEICLNNVGDKLLLSQAISYQTVTILSMPYYLDLEVTAFNYKRDKHNAVKFAVITNNFTTAAAFCCLTRQAALVVPPERLSNEMQNWLCSAWNSK